MKQSVLLFKALGQKTRYRIIEALLLGEKCACELPDIIGRTQSNTSMHLAKLLEWELVKRQRQGKQIIYSIKDERIKKIFNAIGKYEKGKNGISQ